MRLKESLAPPGFADEDQSFDARLLWLILSTLLATSTLMAVILSLILHFYSTSAMLAFGSLMCLTGMRLTRRGHLQTAGLLVSLSFVAILTYILCVGYGIHDIALLGYPVMSIIAGLILNGRGFLAITILSIVSIGGIVYSEVNGLIETRYSQDTSFIDFISISAILATTAVYVRLLAGNLRQNIIRARRNERALAETNLELQGRTLELERQGVALQQERDLVSRLMETSPVGIVRVDRTGRIAFANQRAEQILGLARDEITQRSYNASEWKIADDAGGPIPDEQLPFRQVIESGQPVYDVRLGIESSDGRRVYLSINGAPIIDEAGQIDGMVAAIEDITERKQASEALRASQERFRALIENISEVIALVDADGNLRYISPAVERILGYTAEERLGRDGFELVHPDDAATLRAAFADLLKEPGRRATIEFRILHKNGDWRWVELTGHNMLYAPNVQ
ncbi:MAG: PAS domain-containing protein, partial [Acidobacteriota bacterium]